MSYEHSLPTGVYRPRSSQSWVRATPAIAFTATAEGFDATTIEPAAVLTLTTTTTPAVSRPGGLADEHTVDTPGERPPRLRFVQRARVRDFSPAKAWREGTAVELEGYDYHHARQSEAYGVVLLERGGVVMTVLDADHIEVTEGQR